MEKLYTAPETAEILQLKTDTIRRYIRSGKLKGVKVGKAWLVAESEIKRFITPKDQQD
jgi:excisionase family DNA binding protein